MRGLLVFMLALRLELGEARSEDAYDEACQDIIGIATRAAKAFNSQDHDTAEKLMGEVEAQYRVAIELVSDIGRAAALVRMAQNRLDPPPSSPALVGCAVSGEWLAVRVFCGGGAVVVGVWVLGAVRGGPW